MRKGRRAFLALAIATILFGACFLAYAYRSVPYRFLSDARLEGMDVSPFFGRGADWATRTYRVAGDTDSVAARASQELRSEDGWSRRVWGGNIWFTNEVTGKHVVVGWEVKEGAVQVDVSHPAAVTDRFLNWLRGL